MRPSNALLAVPVLGWIGAASLLNAGASLPTCPFKALTGLDCPGCGSTRAGAALLRGDLLAALDHNLLVTLLPVFTVAVLIADRVSRRSAGRFARLVETRLSVFSLVVTLAFWGLRLVPVGPLRYLAAS